MITKANFADILEDQLFFNRQVSSTRETDVFYRHFDEVESW